MPAHDVVVTNPPFSGDHVSKILRFCSRRGAKPWFLLLPNFVYLKVLLPRPIDRSARKGSVTKSPPVIRVFGFVTSLRSCFDSHRRELLRGYITHCIYPVPFNLSVSLPSGRFFRCFHLGSTVNGLRTTQDYYEPSLTSGSRDRPALPFFLTPPKR